MKLKILSFSCFILIFSCNTNSGKPPIDNPLLDTLNNMGPKEIPFFIVREHPHDTTSFTEGLLFQKGMLFESTGSPDNIPQTKSLVGPVDLTTGQIATKISLDRNIYFGEGIVFFKNKLYELTYQNKVGFIYDATTFKKLGKFDLPSKEGWGFTTDGTNLIMSDGSSKLFFLDPDNLKTKRVLDVKQQGAQLKLLNELEFINGYIYANIFTTNDIVKIDPATGTVVGMLKLDAIENSAKTLYNGSMEMNGIAYDSTGDRIFITGKMWPKLYEIKFEH